jgi:D-glycero-D-manno-heptose 1,7-bisphosphate phosphatase
MIGNKRKAVFLDRDGVINELLYHQEAGVIDSPFTVAQFKLLLQVGEAIRLLNKNGVKVLVVSNQPGIAKNHFTETVLAEMDRKMKEELASYQASLDGIYYCPHHPEAVNPEYLRVCECRKPKPGLILRAAADFHIDLQNSYMIGDNLSDIKAGIAAGCKTILLGKHKCELCHLMDEDGVRPELIVPNLYEAVRRILNPNYA